VLETQFTQDDKHILTLGFDKLLCVTSVEDHNSKRVLKGPGDTQMTNSCCSVQSGEKLSLFSGGYDCAVKHWAC